MALLSVFPQGSVQMPIPAATYEQLQLDRGKLLGKGRPDRLLVDVVLQAADADLGQIGLVLGVHLGGHLEPDRVEQFQQAGEADGLAVVGRGRGEDAMLEQEADLPQHPGPLAGTVAALRGEVVALRPRSANPTGRGPSCGAIGFGIGPAPDAWRNCCSTSGIRR